MREGVIGRANIRTSRRRVRDMREGVIVIVIEGQYKDQQKEGVIVIVIEAIYSILVMSCFIWSGALVSFGVLLLYPIVSLSSHITNILIY